MTNFKDWSNIDSIESLNNLLAENEITCTLFSQPNCGVCVSIKPQLQKLINQNFPSITLGYVDISKNPEIAGKFTIFTIPVLIIFINSKEYIRKSRIINISQLSTDLERLIQLYK